MQLNTSFQIDYYGLSDVGLVRPQNEDAWSVVLEDRLFVLADGMGGHQAGEVAAQLSVELFADWYHEHQLPNQVSVHQQRSKIQEGVEFVNHEVFDRSQLDPALRGMGTTLCTLCFFARDIVYAHVGDSRIYRLRDSVLEQLTEDHTLYTDIKAGRGRGNPNSNSKNVLTRAVGTASVVEPTINSCAFELGDVYMLCSDGLTNFVAKKSLQKVLNRTKSLEKSAETLINLAKEAGGRDNITLILVKVGHDLPR